MRCPITSLRTSESKLVNLFNPFSLFSYVFSDTDTSETSEESLPVVVEEKRRRRTKKHQNVSKKFARPAQHQDMNAPLAFRNIRSMGSRKLRRLENGLL
jgi:hypothetical protein